MRIKSNLVGTNIYIKNYELADKLFCTNMWFNKVNGKYLSDPTEEFVDDNYCQTIFYKGIMPSETGFRFSSGL